MITRLGLRLNHLREHEHEHRYNRLISPICACSLTLPKTTEHFLLCCLHFSQILSHMLDNACNVTKTDINFSLNGDYAFNDTLN